MAENIKASFMLTVEKGKNKGKVFHFSQASVEIGRSDSCDVILADDSVSRQHAAITLDGRSFVITDSSTNGIFINGSRIRGQQKLAHGDLIGVGPDYILRYEEQSIGGEVVSESKSKGWGKPKAVSDVTEQIKTLLKQKPLLAAGLGAYAVFLVFLFFYLTFSSGGRGRVTRDQADRLVKQTELFLVGSSSPDKSTGQGTNFALAAQLLSEGKALEAIESEDPGATYLILSKYRQALRLCGILNPNEYERVRKETGAEAGVPDQVAQAYKEALQRMLARVHELVFLGWLAESRGRKDEAIRTYERVLAVLPEEGAPSYRFALGRIRDLKR